MKKLLSIGMVAKLVGLSSQTLRYYANRKVIRPRRNKNNGYRYFSRASITQLLRSRYLMSMGFPIEDVVSQCSQGLFDERGALRSKGMSVKEWFLCVDKQRKVLETDIQKLNGMLERLSAYHQQNEEIDELCGNFRIEHCREMLFFRI